MKKHILFLFLFVFLCGITLNVYGQDQDGRRWSVDPRASHANVFDLPAQQVTTTFKGNPNTKPHIYDSRAGIVTVNPNFRVHPSANVWQSEVPIVASSVNRDWIFGSSNAYMTSGLQFSEGVYLSADGGQTWFGSDTLAAAPITDHGGDPAPAIGPDGTLYESYLAGSGYQYVKATVSTDFGQTWSAGHILINAGYSGVDKNHTVVNEVASSPYLGRVLVSWSDFQQSNPPIIVSWSSDNGSTWSTATDINTPDPNHYCQGVNGAIGANGDFYLVWANPITSGSYTEDYMGFAKSTDGGVTWTYNNNVYDVNGIRGNLFASQIRVNGFPWMGVDRTGGQRNGWIYVTEAEKNLAPAGSDPDIIMHRSTDGGTTWSPGIRVNQDPLNNGKYQYMPALCVGDDGSVNIVYYDTRNCTGDSAEVYVSHSTDGGDTWTDILVSDHRFKPMPISGLAGGYQGDYIGICEGSNGTYYPLWCDNYTGMYQAWTTAVTFEPPCTSVDPPTNPNPASGSVDVSINLSQITWDNGNGAVSNEVYFGTSPANLQLVQSGSLSNSYDIPNTLTYYTNYYWKVKEIGDTCNVSGPTWTFRTVQDPNYVMVTDTLRPQSAQFWTGNTEGTTKTDGEINTVDPNVGWAAFDISSIPSIATVDAITFYGYINDISYPYWSATPMGDVNPVTADAASINSQIQANYGADVAYIYSQDNLSSGWYNSSLDNSGMTDLQTAVSQSKGWFAMGFIDWDFSSQWYINFDGWSQSNPPYLLVQYHYITPVELTSFNATSNDGSVSLNWATATETNNKGFEIQRKSEDGSFTKIGFINGAGTSSQPHTYSYVDSKLSTGEYTYRLRQVDLDGKESFSQEVNVKVNVPLAFGLEQNFPNPFNPTTQINYSIAKDGYVSLTIFNSLGQEVSKLVDGVETAGKHIVNFNASKLASGVYFYRLQQNSKVSVKKMMLLK